MVSPQRFEDAVTFLAASISTMHRLSEASSQPPEGEAVAGFGPCRQRQAGAGGIGHLGQEGVEGDIDLDAGPDQIVSGVGDGDAGPGKDREQLRNRGGGALDLSRAQAPATWGAAMEVPSKLSKPSPGTEVRIPWPGASRSSWGALFEKRETASGVVPLPMPSTEPTLMTPEMHPES